MAFKKNIPLSLLIILSLGLILRLWGITSESYWLDEAISIRQAQGTFEASQQLIKTDINLPFYVNLLHFWVVFFGTSELSSRSLSLIFGVISIWLVYLLAKKLFSKKIALISSAFMSVSPLMIYYSQETRLYSLFVMLALFSFYYFVKYIDEKDNKNLFFYGFFSLLLIYTHLFSFLVLLVQNVYILYAYKFQIKKLLFWFMAQIILVLLFIPWIPNLFLQLNNTLFTSWIAKPDFFLIFYTYHDFFGNAFNLMIFILLLVTLIRFKKFKASEKRPVVFLGCWIILPFIVVLFYSLLITSVYHTRYLLFTVPGVLIFFSVVIDKISEKKRYVRYFLIGIIIISSLISVAYHAKRADKDDWRAVNSFIKENVNEDEIVFINPFYHQDPFTYYYDPECFKERFIPSCNYKKNMILSMDWQAECCSDKTLLTARSGRNELGYYIEKNIWLISVRPELYDIDNSLFSYFSSRKKMTVTKDIGEIKIYKFE